MYSAGKRLIESALQALDFAEDTADTTEYLPNISKRLV